MAEVDSRNGKRDPEKGGSATATIHETESIPNAQPATGQLSRQLKNRHIAMIRYTEFIFTICWLCLTEH